MSIEIYWSENRTMLMLEEIETSEVQRLDDADNNTIQRFDNEIAATRPNTYKSLCEEFGYGPSCAYDRVFQFAACNFSTRDGRPDIDDESNMVTEIVSCPVRHKCDRRYCFNETVLSPREIQIIKMTATGREEAAIAEALFISKATVHNHITNIYHKLGLSGSNHPDRLLITYAYNHKLLK